eukprot:Lithocolla_globosa_v1_NODE_508_length_3874_cov_42.660382.p2 type:complete len:242 gc:universal NODE_508_length_3874_cov_42.660382:1233-1958(+)
MEWVQNQLKETFTGKVIRSICLKYNIAALLMGETLMSDSDSFDIGIFEVTSVSNPNSKGSNKGRVSGGSQISCIQALNATQLNTGFCKAYGCAITTTLYYRDGNNNLEIIKLDIHNFYFRWHKDAEGIIHAIKGLRSRLRDTQKHHHLFLGGDANAHNPDYTYRGTIIDLPDKNKKDELIWDELLKMEEEFDLVCLSKYSKGQPFTHPANSLFIDHVWLQFVDSSITLQFCRPKAFQIITS